MTNIPPINQSALKVAWKKGWRYFYASEIARTVPKKPESYFAVGTAIHTFLLEPSKFNERVLEIPKEVLGKGDKKNTTAWDNYEAENKGKVLLKPAEMQQVLACVESITHHPAAMEILAAPAHIEQPITADIFGVTAKGIPDIAIKRGGVVVDVKSTEAVDELEFKQQIKKYGYDIQAAWYLELCSAFYKKEYTNFVFIAVEKQPPYRCRCYYLGGDYLRDGREEAQKLAAEYARRYAANDWLEDCDKNIILIEKGKW